MLILHQLREGKQGQIGERNNNKDFVALGRATSPVQ